MASPSASRALAALVPLVDAFGRRHRSQHRASHWWASFTILRRSLRALADGRLPPRHVVARARWLARHVVPRAYVAFTQLAADNQHAPLGLMLLAVLARAHAALAHLAPPEPPQAPPSAPPRHSEPPGPDRGVVVSRREVLAAHRPLTSDPSKHSRRGHKDPKRRSNKHATNNGADALSSLFSSLD